MSCCSTFCAATQRQFSSRVAARDLARYRRKGPDATSRILRDLIMASTAAGGTLLDIGAGVGPLTFELMRSGFRRATAVEASPAYAASGREETGRQGHNGVVDWVEGDFVALAADLPGADVVTLDKVVCCYPNYESLLEAAMNHVGQSLGLSYPRDRWIVRVVMALENGLRRIRGEAFRTFVHSPSDMSALLRARGFDLVARKTTIPWCLEVYRRAHAGPAGPERAPTQA